MTQPATPHSKTQPNQARFANKLIGFCLCDHSSHPGILPSNRQFRGFQKRLLHKIIARSWFASILSERHSRSRLHFCPDHPLRSRSCYTADSKLFKTLFQSPQRQPPRHSATCHRFPLCSKPPTLPAHSARASQLSKSLRKTSEFVRNYDIS